MFYTQELCRYVPALRYFATNIWADTYYFARYYDASSSIWYHFRHARMQINLRERQLLVLHRKKYYFAHNGEVYRNKLNASQHYSVKKSAHMAIYMFVFTLALHACMHTCMSVYTPVQACTNARTSGTTLPPPQPPSHPAPSSQTPFQPNSNRYL